MLDAICLCSPMVMLIMPAVASGNESAYAPDWNSAQARRVIRISADTSANEIENGEKLRKAAAALSPGDHLEIGAGTFSIEQLWDLSVSGTEDAPIVITASQNAKVIITRPDARQNIINIGQRRPVHHVVLRGLEFTGGSHGIRLGDCSDVWIDGCHIHHTGDVCISANSADSHHLYLTRNTIHDGGGTAEGMYLGGNHGVVTMSQSVIALNHVFNCRGSQGDGIEVKQGSWGNLVAENTVHDCNYPCITVYGTGGKRQNIVERNTCYRSNDNVMQIQGEAIVRNNVVIGGKNAALASTDHQAKTTNLQVIHNTLVNAGHAFRGTSWKGRRNMVLANNVIYSRLLNAIHFPNGSDDVTVQGNVVLGQGAKYGSQMGRGLHDFVDVTWTGDKHDATPTQRAPFDAGAAPYSLPIDINGKKRPASSTISGAVVP